MLHEQILQHLFFVLLDKIDHVLSFHFTETSHAAHGVSGDRVFQVEGPYVIFDKAFFQALFDEGHLELQQWCHMAGGRPQPFLFF